MTDDDVVQLLDRAASLAPDRLDREPVADVTRRRGRRRTALGGATAAALVALGAVVVPGALGGRQVLTPAAGPDVGTQFFRLPAVPEVSPCTQLPGAGLVYAASTFSPTNTVSAVGPAEQRAAVEGCLRALGEVTEVFDPELRAVTLSVQTLGMQGLVASVGNAVSWQMAPGVQHDLELTNASAAPVFVQDLSFGEVLDAGLFVGSGCSPEGADGEGVGCLTDYAPTELPPGRSRVLRVQVQAAAERWSPLPIGTHELEMEVLHRTAPAFAGPDDTAGTRGALRLRYDITGPSGQEPDVSRAAFLPAPGPGDEALGTGILSGDPATGCLWLQQVPGGEATPLLLYSDTARADFSSSPFRIVDGDRVLAVGGSPVEVGGGFGGAVGVPGCPVDGPPFVGGLLEGGG